MVDTNALRGEIVRKGYNLSSFAKAMEMSPRTLYSKMKNGIFTNREIEKAAMILNLSDPFEIFFAN